MGLCFSKKKKQPPGGASSKKVAAAVVADDKAKKTAQQPKSADKNAVKAKDAAPASGEERREEEKSGRRRRTRRRSSSCRVVVLPSGPVRTSSCTREEVDAILIQCGRLSRSSSGTGRTPSRETGSHHRRRRSGSKRSYDFDQEQKAGDEEGNWESGRPASRPSPHRGSPQRKRSGSRERSSGGGSGSRRASRSPGRRGAEGGGVSSSAAAAGGGAREAAAAGEDGVRAGEGEDARGRRVGDQVRVAEVELAGEDDGGGGGERERMRCAGAEQELVQEGRAVAVPAEPHGRDRREHAPEQQRQTSSEEGHGAREGADCYRKRARSGNKKRETAEDATAADARPLSAKTNATRTVSVAAESLSQRPRSRRASRDLDQGSSNSYASQLLEDIQNYHNEQHQASATPSFSLPACVAKACSILDAVADLNSSSTSSSSLANNNNDYSADDKGSVNDYSAADKGSGAGRWLL
ncbi:hypothetical protein PR202_ga02109 [Eleusine coracana subsp. coracana]|uniref:Uncharacterized protein n=1 Tax=Eleusine coracana subsp. coracana TaxID=191504 RepID=A0AAV5BIZ9_ELECO|nr:hypothetical protein PR202_ga01421 [Eleusine coracana subsp. coracana]GJM86266.1 hypothetical protein PR202_ga02109 [Eleusine coracana subsp. coracana]